MNPLGADVVLLHPHRDVRQARAEDDIGTSGATSAADESRSRFHQRTSKSTAGREQVTVLLSRASTKSAQRSDITIRSARTVTAASSRLPRAQIRDRRTGRRLPKGRSSAP